jgi:hypothetical protein
LTLFEIGTLGWYEMDAGYCCCGSTGISVVKISC